MQTKILPRETQSEVLQTQAGNHGPSAMLESGICMFYVPQLLGEIALELFAVLRS